MESIDLVTHSFGRCLAQGDFLFDRFYHYLLKENAQIKTMFTHTNMAKQKQLLRSGINYAIMFSSQQTHQMAEKALGRIRHSHAEVNMNIPPTLYPLWIASLLKSIAETDPKFDPQVQAAWKTVLEKAVQYIAEGYREHPTP